MSQPSDTSTRIGGSDGETIGALIRRHRIERGLTQEALGEAVGRKQSSIALIESDTRRIKADELPAFAAALALPIWAFFDWDGDTSDPYAVAYQSGYRAALNAMREHSQTLIEALPDTREARSDAKSTVTHDRP